MSCLFCPRYFQCAIPRPWIVSNTKSGPRVNKGCGQKWKGGGGGGGGGYSLDPPLLTTVKAVPSNKKAEVAACPARRSYNSIMSRTNLVYVPHPTCAM